VGVAVLILVILMTAAWAPTGSRDPHYVLEINGTCFTSGAGPLAVPVAIWQPLTSLALAKQYWVRVPRLHHSHCTAKVQICFEDHEHNTTICMHSRLLARVSDTRSPLVETLMEEDPPSCTDSVSGLGVSCPKDFMARQETAAQGNHCLTRVSPPPSTMSAVMAGRELGVPDQVVRCYSYSGSNPTLSQCFAWVSSAGAVPCWQ
jgi:hypothetical protein